MGNVQVNITDLKYLNWDISRNSSGTVGTFLKSYEINENKKIYYKLSNYDSYNGIIGHECINEIIVDRLLDILGIDHLSYELINGIININNKEYNTWLCKSYDFKDRNESKLALDIYYQMNKLDNESPLEFCIRLGFEKQIYEMLVVDYIILNRDRHGANIEVLKNSKNGNIKLAPIFDHGMSLFCSCNDVKQVLSSDILEDKRVQCFVGTNSAYDNLSLIPKNKMPRLNKLTFNHKEIILKDLDKAIDKKWLDKIFDMIYKRYTIYENLRNKK